MAAAEDSELLSFITKFRNLWHTGKHATLTSECNAGKASLTLHLQLQPLHQQQPHPDLPYPRRVGPSRLRRRARRAQSRSDAAAKAANLSQAKASEQVVDAPKNPTTATVAVQAAPEAVTCKDVGIQASRPEQGRTGQQLLLHTGPSGPRQPLPAEPSPTFLPVLHQQLQQAALVLPCQSDSDQALPGSGIPQLDGDAFDTSTHECDNCHQKFTTEVQLKHHDETYKYGCEDCSICYRSTYLFDLHELAEHPNTHYALSIIPHSTKLQFARSYK